MAMLSLEPLMQQYAIKNPRCSQPLYHKLDPSARRAAYKRLQSLPPSAFCVCYYEVSVNILKGYDVASTISLQDTLLWKNHCFATKPY